jgi:hypothetical protein
MAMNRSLSVSAIQQIPFHLADGDRVDQIWSPLNLLASESASLAKWRSLAVEGQVVPSYVLQIPVSNRVIASEVLWPALELAQRLVPLPSEPIQVFPGLQNNCHSLFSLGHARPGPFSLIIRTPKHTPVENQISAIVFTVKQILHYYRVLVSQAGSL